MLEVIVLSMVLSNPCVGDNCRLLVLRGTVQRAEVVLVKGIQVAAKGIRVTTKGVKKRHARRVERRTQRGSN